VPADLPPTPCWDDVDVDRLVLGVPRRLDPTTTVLQVSGSQDWNLIHHDPAFAIDSGHADVLYNTGWTSATMARVLTDWVGAAGWLLHLEIRMGAANGPGDTVQAKARVVRKYQRDGARLVDLEVWIDNAAKGVTTTGTAVVRLP
jgi:acyl dehydratase